MKYLFNNWSDFKKNIESKYILLFLDYDGTLTPIVKSPRQARLPKTIKDLLYKLSRNLNCKVAVISGRSLRDLKGMVGLNNIIYSGNHGLELTGPKIRFKNPVSSGFKRNIAKIKNELNKRIISIKGAFLEDKKLSLSLHYRLVNKRNSLCLKAIFCEIVSPYRLKNEIKIKSGKKVFEIRPPVEWDKGKIVLWLMAKYKFAICHNRLFPIYIGDDTTDEDAFGVLKRKGLTVFVGRPKISQAQYYLKNTEEVESFLRTILALKKDRIYAQAN